MQLIVVMTTTSNIPQPWLITFLSSCANEHQTNDFLKDKVNNLVASTVFNLTHVFTPSNKKKSKLISYLLKEFKITFEDVFGNAYAGPAFNVKIEHSKNDHLFMD